MDFDSVSERYSLLQELGQGGFSTVYLALDNVLDRHVALKILKLPEEGANEITQRFWIEAKIASRLNHPNTVSVYDFGKAPDGRHFIVTELLEGESLFDYLLDGPAPLDLALEIMQQAINALRKAHELDIIHRDIKPANIYLVEPMRGPTFVKLLDFGIAKMKETQSHTVTGQMLGTPRYMSPEQIINIKYVDYRSDIYSLGIVFFQLVSGVIPFDDPSYYVIMRQHMQKHLPPLRIPGVPPEITQQVEKLIQSMTVKNVDKRLDSLAVVNEHIVEWQTKYPEWAAINAREYNTALQKVHAYHLSNQFMGMDSIDQVNQPRDYMKFQTSPDLSNRAPIVPSVDFELDEVEKYYIHQANAQNQVGSDHPISSSSSVMSSEPIPGSFEVKTEVDAPQSYVMNTNVLPSSTDEMHHVRSQAPAQSTYKNIVTSDYASPDHLVKLKAHHTPIEVSNVNAGSSELIASTSTVPYVIKASEDARQSIEEIRVETPNQPVVHSSHLVHDVRSEERNIAIQGTPIQGKPIQGASTQGISQSISTQSISTQSVSEPIHQASSLSYVPPPTPLQSSSSPYVSSKAKSKLPTVRSIADHGVSATEMGFHVTRTFPKDAKNKVIRSANSLEEMVVQNAQNIEEDEIQSFVMPFSEDEYGMSFSFRDTFLLNGAPPTPLPQMALFTIYILNPSEFVANLYAQGIHKASQSKTSPFKDRVYVRVFQKLEHVLEAMEKQKAQLVLMEINARPNGVQPIEELKKAYKKVNVIVTAADVNHKEAAILAGAKEFLVKPIQGKKLTQIVFSFLKTLK